MSFCPLPIYSQSQEVQKKSVSPRPELVEGISVESVEGIRVLQICFRQTPAEQPKVNCVDLVDDDKTFDKARFTRKICQVHVVGQNLCVPCDLCG